MTKKSETPELPTSIDADPRVVDAGVTSANMRVAAAEIAVRVQRLEDALRGAEGADSIGAAARKMLQGASAATVAPNVTRLQTELIDAQRELRIAEQAVKMAEQAEQQVRREVEAELLPQVKAVYGALATEIGDTIIKLKELANREHTMREAYNGTSGRLRFIPSKIHPMVPRFDDHLAAVYMVEGRDHGLIPADRLQRLLELEPSLRRQFA